MRGDVTEPDACLAHAEMDGRAPREYETWTRWANDMARTHVQRRCPGCGLWKIWEPRTETT